MHHEVKSKKRAKIPNFEAEHSAETKRVTAAKSQTIEVSPYKEIRTGDTICV
jgi:hypothetical protein